jgi:hypothetical protein
MPVPEYVIFGPKPNGQGQYTYGDVRELDSSNQMGALKARLDVWLLEQTGELCRNNEQGDRFVYSPFPLAVMTCVAIGTLGEIFYGDLSDDKERRSDPFRNVLCKIDDKFSRSLEKKEKEAFEKLWPKKFKRAKHRSAGHIIYTFYRNTLIHGFRGQMVFITEDADVSVWAIKEGAIYLNPYQLWDAFVSKAYKAYWSLVFSKGDCSEKTACLDYIATLLS